VRARFGVPKGARSGTLRYGLSDESVESENPSPITVVLESGDSEVLRIAAGNERGLESADFALDGDSPLVLEITCERDGSRVFGFDIDLHE